MTEPRSWVLTETGARPTTLNEWVRMSHFQRHRLDKDTRELWGWKALQQNPRIPRLDQVWLAITPLHADGRSPQDVVGCAAYAKAAIDGLIIDGRICPDDGPRYVVGVYFRPPRIGGFDGIEIVINEAL